MTDHAHERPKFTIVLRGDERREVDRFVADAQARIADLEATVARLTAKVEDAGPA